MEGGEGQPDKGLSQMEASAGFIFSPRIWDLERSEGEKCAPGCASQIVSPGRAGSMCTKQMKFLCCHPGVPFTPGVNMRTELESAATRPESAGGTNSHPPPGSHSRECCLWDHMPIRELRPTRFPPSAKCQNFYGVRIWREKCMAIFLNVRQIKHNQRLSTGLLKMIIINNKARKDQYKHGTPKA